MKLWAKLFGSKKTDPLLGVRFVSPGVYRNVNVMNHRCRFRKVRLYGNDQLWRCKTCGTLYGRNNEGWLLLPARHW